LWHFWQTPRLSIFRRRLSDVPPPALSSGVPQESRDGNQLVATLLAPLKVLLESIQVRAMHRPAHVRSEVFARQVCHDHPLPAGIR
jgi:hypothetical protein